MVMHVHATLHIWRVFFGRLEKKLIDKAKHKTAERSNFSSIQIIRKNQALHAMKPKYENETHTNVVAYFDAVERI